MQTHIAQTLRDTPDGAAADAILRKCVHCGFCLATCPTYQLRGDELDSPRGRIYLIKEMLESGQANAATQRHLDRCLGCRACETTCPSGVRYAELADIGRRMIEKQRRRPLGQALLRGALRFGLTSPLFSPALRLGRWLRPLLPRILRDKVPAASEMGAATGGPSRTAPLAPRRAPGLAPAAVILPRGCVQPALDPAIDAATERVLAALGVAVLRPPAGPCCGAIRAHLADQRGGLEHARANIDAWWPLLASGAASAIVSNASGCGLTLREYGHWFAGDRAYADKAQRVAAATLDIGEYLAQQRLRWPADWTAAPRQRVAWHPPCSLQHGLRAASAVEATLAELGFDLQRPADAHLCCGSAGTYSVLQGELARELRRRKLENLGVTGADCIITANIGCQQHLQAASAVPVRHWVQLLAERCA